MDEHPSSIGISARSKKATSLASLITGVEAIAVLIPNPVIKNVVIISAPFLSYIFTIFCKSIIHAIESNRGIKVYKSLIEDLEEQLLQNQSPEIKKQLEKELVKLRGDLQQAKKDTIKIVVY